MAVPNGIILYGYPFSPYANKVKAYLALRKIEYAECIQPHMMPRPDVALLGIHYRRIPLMALGRDVYIDTRAILSRLEEVFPPSAKHPGLTTPQSEGTAKLLHEFIGGAGGVFGRATGQLTPNSGAGKDPKFQKDREDFFGPKYFQDGWKESNKEGLTHMRLAFGVVEAALQDGREWIAGTNDLSDADLHGQWVFQWYLTDLRAPKEYFNAQEYPSTFAWIARFNDALSSAIKQNPKPVRIKGEQALTAITAADFTDTAVSVDARDPLQLPSGTFVSLWPTDGGGRGYQDYGSLVKLTRDQVAISLEASNGKEIRLHAPRWNFRIRAAQPEKAQL